MAAYDTFADAATTDELNVVLSGTEVPAHETFASRGCRG